MGVVDYLIRRRVKTLEDRWHVFEVTDLLIPQGTDWSGDFHLLEPTVDVSIESGLLFALWIEVELSTNNDLLLMAAINGTICPSDQLGNPAMAQLDANVNSFNGRVVLHRLSSFIADTSSPVVPVGAALTTGGPTTSDITVVHARAAFQVI